MSVCTSCLLAWSKKRSIETKKQSIVPEKEGILSVDNYKPIYFVSTDQFMVNNHVQLPTEYVRDYYSSLFHGGALYNDADTGII